MITNPGTVGFQKRKTAEIRILNGDPLIAGSYLTPCLKVVGNSKNVGQVQGFLSGEPMVMVSGEERGSAVFFSCSEGDPSGSYVKPGKGTVCFAVQDFIILNGVPTVTADASGLLQGLSTLNAGREIATAFFDTTKTYKVGEPLTVKAKSGLPAGNTPINGWVVTNEVVEGDVIIGYVTKGVIDAGTTVSGTVYQNGQPLGATTSDPVDYSTGGCAVWVNDSETSQMLQFAFGGQPTVAATE